ncbi:MAG: cytochrome P450, partial [Hamadaea sp.]|uniref:hypothetical protein n=1 Tax=Hamadaea sp. TaxID=2024425 RepID=UPI0017E2084B
MNEVEIRRYAEARAALAHPGLSRARMRSGHDVDAHVLNMDGPDHVRHRQAVDAALSAAVTAQLPLLTAAVRTAIEELPAGTPVDAGGEVAYRLSVAVVDLVVGLGGPQSHPYWAGLAQGIDFGVLSPDALPEALARLTAVAQEAHPHTMAAALSRSALSPSEVAANLLFAVSAGITNLTNALGAALLALARHPDAYAWLAADPATRLTSATDELLRFGEPAGRHSTRVASDGRTSRIFKAAANRDPSRYADPDRLDLARTPNPHLTFGHGRHYCPAAFLSRLVLDQTLLALVRR